MLLQITHHNKCAFMVIQHSYLAIELRGQNSSNIHQVFELYTCYRESTYMFRIVFEYSHCKNVR